MESTRGLLEEKAEKHDIVTKTAPKLGCFKWCSEKLDEGKENVTVGYATRTHNLIPLL